MHEGLLGSQRPVDLGPLMQQMGRLWEGFRFLISWNMTELVLKLRCAPRKTCEHRRGYNYCTCLWTGSRNENLLVNKASATHFAVKREDVLLTLFLIWGQ